MIMRLFRILYTIGYRVKKKIWENNIVRIIIRSKIKILWLILRYCRLIGIYTNKMGNSNKMLENIYKVSLEIR